MRPENWAVSTVTGLPSFLPRASARSTFKALDPARQLRHRMRRERPVDGRFQRGLGHRSVCGQHREPGGCQQLLIATLRDVSHDD